MAHTQDTRFCQVEGPLGPNDLLVGRLSAVEAVSRLFQIELDLFSPRADIRSDELLGQPLQITMELNTGQKRLFHGFVSRYAQGETEGELFAYRVEVVPWMWFLSRNVDCRIFQDQTVPQILETIFTDHGFKGMFEITAPGLTKPREYCVQYRESDLNFVTRLMEEEGLFYFFLHEDKKHTLIVSDGSRKLPEVSPKKVSMRTGDPLGRDIENWSAERELHSGAFGTAEYNLEERKVISSLELTAATLANNTKFEVFDFPSEQIVIADSDHRAQLRMQTEEATAARHSGGGRLPGFAAGHRFELTDHFHAPRNGEYMLTTVHHSVAQEFTKGGSNTYFNSFSAVLASKPFHPPLVTPKPIVQGPQTALVVGKDDRGKIDPAQSDDDIDVDELGRVLVKFHWDRSGPNAKRDSQKKHESSCRARVSQDWAGKNWGSVFWPRIGQEVIVEFIEGDPDHPIITGRVYNGKFKPPYDLPANKTQSGIKTRSTPNGTPENFNEIRFEDKKGKEEISIHAERNLSTSVEADESRSVGGNRSTTVQKDESLTVAKGNRKIDVQTGTHTETIKGNTSITVTTGTYSHDVKTGTALYHVKAALTENYDDTQTTTVKKLITIDGKASILIQAADEIRLQVGAGFISIKKDGTIKVSSDKIETAGGTEVKVGVGNQSVTCDKQKVGVAGAAINAAAVGMHEITGAVVKIN
jgi:type VI secretion system secreted protein VgrG